MADLDQIKVRKTNTIYDIKDSTARAAIGNLSAVASSGDYDDLLDKPTLGSAASKETTASVSQYSQALPTSEAVYNAIAAALASVLVPAGSKYCSQLDSDLLNIDHLGEVYNMEDSGTTTSDFVDGSGHPINAGDNVYVCRLNSPDGYVYKFDLISGFIDLSNYVQKSNTAGLLKNDGTVDTSSYATTAAVSSKLANGDVAVEFSAESLEGYWVGQYVMKDGHLYKCNTNHTGAWNASHFDRIAYISTQFGERKYMAPIWNAGLNVAVGEIVFRNNMLYKCTSAHSGAWDDADFTPTTLGGEIKNVSTALSDLGFYVDSDGYVCQRIV